MTLTQKILASHAGKKEVATGELVMAKLDLVLANDITAPVAIGEFPAFGRETVFDREKIALVPDHFAPNKDIKAAAQCALMRSFAREHKIANYFETGHDCGIEHALLPEKGLVVPGDAVIGADSHTCTYGALGAFSTGVGSTDAAFAMASGRAWFRVPEAIEVRLEGEFAPRVSGKDLILHLIGLIGVDGARYSSLEFTGPGVKALTMDDRFTVANMAIEAGAKNGIFPVDETTLAYLADYSHAKREGRAFAPDPDAAYSRTIEIDLSALRPTVAFPHLPSNTRTIDEAAGVKLDQVVIGSCTNGRIGDLRKAAAVMKGRRVAPHVRCIVIPATQRVYMEALDEGLVRTFIEAGCVVSTPTCGPCLGGYMGILAKGEKCLATTNRNFIGRMGHVESEVYLASPEIAAISAIAGEIAGFETSQAATGGTQFIASTQKDSACPRPHKRLSRVRAAGAMAFKYGDNIDTDVIIPARYLNTPDAKELAAHCMEDIDSAFATTVRGGDVIVAGSNFGCGSSREHAPLAIKTAGVKCVIAASFARIFYRNALNIALPILECADAAREIADGDEIAVDLATGEIRDFTTQKTYHATPFPPFMQRLIAAGGLKKMKFEE